RRGRRAGQIQARGGHQARHPRRAHRSGRRDRRVGHPHRRLGAEPRRQSQHHRVGAADRGDQLMLDRGPGAHHPQCGREPRLLLVMTRTDRRARPSRVFAPAHYRVSHSAGDRVRPAPAERSPRTTSQVIRSLAPSVYIPSLLEFTGQAALMPVIPLLALQLGFSVPQAAALTTIFGIASFLGPIPAGRLISRVGARPALVTTGSLLVVANLVAFTVISHGLEAGAGLAHQLTLVGLLTMMAASAQVWMLGRQSYLGTALPPAMRARGMTMFGGVIRIGQVAGPLLGALVL